VAKKFPKETKGVYLIDNKEKRIKALKWLKVQDIWGIGRKSSKKLVEQNIINAYQFTLLSDELVKKTMSVVELRLKQDLEGKPILHLEKRQAKKNISTTRTFEKNYSTFEEINERIVSFAVACAAKLRKQQSCCTAIMVFIRTNYFDKDSPQYQQNTIIRLPFATNSSIEIAQYATQGLKQIFQKGYRYKKAGVIIMDFCPENQVQHTIFENSNPKHKTLMEVMDKVNTSLGQQKIKLAIQDQNRVWKMKQENLSPRYTTRLDEIITINASK
jgi:DNA polymerase V